MVKKIITYKVSPCLYIEKDSDILESLIGELEEIRENFEFDNYEPDIVIEIGSLTVIYDNSTKAKCFCDGDLVASFIIKNDGFHSDIPSIFLDTLIDLSTDLIKKYSKIDKV
jgi:hypothetical protein